MAVVRYLVKDVDVSIKFYTDNLGFIVDQHTGPAFARVIKNDLILWLSGPLSSAARPMPDGSQPVSGGWNRFAIVVKDLQSQVNKLKAAGVHFRNDIVTGPGGKQIVLDDPDGNPIELFEPAS